MPDYKQADVAGTKWTRARKITIENPRDDTPTITFTEEAVIVLQDGEVRQPVGAVSLPFDPVAHIALYDPTTGLPTGEQMTEGEVYAILYSCYMKAAKARDDALASE